MAGYGRIQGALTALTQDTTLALVNGNFNFSLVRVDASAEYKGLGAALSHRRRSAAEHGTLHRTACMLGALFEQVLPSTPHLFKAYGIRASEIAQSPLVNPKGSQAHGPFAEHIGIDGTTIWAAATSGKGAVAIHLLACMLARLWPPSEAIAIWQQILEERKKELSNWDATETIPLVNLTTGQIEVSREELAGWDASARAWLRAADRVKSFNQTQLRLIVENLNIPVDQNMNVYTSVMQAWKTAMTTLDKLINGISHSVHNGAVLLGLSSWHLYPDLITLGNSTAETRQKDPLIAPGGIVTIGLQIVEQDDGRGVYWSLPLAHVLYYGDPVVSERSINSDGSRISFDDLWLVTLGSLFAVWKTEGLLDEAAAELIRMMWQNCEKGLAAVERFTLRQPTCRDSWLRYLADAARRFLESSGDEKRVCKRLLGLGARKGTLFGQFSNPVSVFGLTDTSLMNILRLESRIQYLRDIARKICKETDVLVIKSCIYAPGTDGKEMKSLQLATVNFSTSMARHRPNRWLFPYEYPDNLARLWHKSGPLPDIRDNEEFHGFEEDSLVFLKDWRFKWIDPPKSLIDSESVTRGAEGTAGPTPANTKSRRWGIFPRAIQKVVLSKPVAIFEPVYGDASSAALFRMTSLEGVPFRVIPKYVAVPKKVSCQQISEAFMSGVVDPDCFLSYLNDETDTRPHQKSATTLAQHSNPDVDNPDVEPSQRARSNHLSVLETLRAIATAASVYAHMPNATVALRVIDYGALTKAHWLENKQQPTLRAENENHEINMLLPYVLSRSATFACVSMFESGGFDLQGDDLKRVMAMSAGDSIFVAAPLLCDPAVRSEPSELRRIAGNIGRAGIAFMVPPICPRIKKLELESYQVINHDFYNGKVENNFQDTTLHLGFSGYEFPLDVGDHGGRNREAFFLETLISVHDRGEWFADLDALEAVASPSLINANHLVPTCHHTESDRHAVPEGPLITIDRWEELLEMPKDAAVVRTHGNWPARLATAAVSVKMGNSTILCPGHGCLACCENTLGHSADAAVGIHGESQHIVYIQ